MDRRRFFGGKTLAAALAICGALSVLPLVTAPVATGVTKETWGWNLATGVKLTRIRYSTPHEIRVLTVTPSAGARLDVMTGGSIIGTTRKTSGQAVNVAGNSVAGVNGDFPAGPGYPAHALMVDGELWSSGAGGRGMALGVTADGSRAWVGAPTLAIKAASAAGARLQVAAWNGLREKGAQVVGYTRRGGFIAQPDGVASPGADDPIWCAARLVPTSGYGWNGAAKKAIVRSYQVEAQPEPCEKTPLSLGTDPDAVVLVAKAGTVPGEKVRNLNPGNSVRLSWAFVGWPGTVDVIGGNPQLVADGKNVAPPYTAGDYLTAIHPRTTVGVTQGCPDDDPATVCKILLLTVDGRQAADGWSAGMKLPQVAAELIALKAWDAMNLDGGGSTTMWARRKRSGYCQRVPSTGGCLVNRPPGAERSVISGVAVLSGLDEATPIGLR